MVIKRDFYFGRLSAQTEFLILTISGLIFNGVILVNLYKLFNGAQLTKYGLVQRQRQRCNVTI